MEGAVVGTVGLFICEKCGHIDNTACDNNYRITRLNKYKREKGEEAEQFFKPEFRYFEDHACCTECCKEVEYRDGDKLYNGFELDERDHWSKYGEKKLLEWEAKRDGSMMNATEYFASHKI